MLYGCLVIFDYLKFVTHFGFLLMPKGERNEIKSRTHMSNQTFDQGTVIKNFKKLKNKTEKDTGRLARHGPLSWPL